MVFGTIGTLIDKIKDLVVDYFNGITKQFNDTIDEIRGDIKGVSEKIDGVQAAVDANNVSDEIQALKQNVANIELGINDGVQSEIGAVKNTLDNRFDAVDGKLATLTENFNRLFNEQETEMNRLRADAAQVENLRTTLAEKEHDFNELNAEFKSLQEKYGNLSNEFTDMDGKFTAAQDELKIERQNSSAAQNALQMWRDAVADYAPVRDAMKNCDTFGKLLEERGLNDETDVGLFAFVQELGKTIDFLRDVHQMALDAKKSQAVPALMTADELAVYEALNKCYRRIWNIDFDVFVTPGERKPVGDIFYKIPFNKDDAIVLKDLRNKSLKLVKGIYVPLLLNREGKMYKQAYVDAVNF